MSMTAFWVIVIIAAALGLGWLFSLGWSYLHTRPKLKTNMLSHDCDMDMEKLDEGDPNAMYGEYLPDPMFRKDE